jgi:hypothetical protein
VRRSWRQKIADIRVEAPSARIWCTRPKARGVCVRQMTSTTDEPFQSWQTVRVLRWCDLRRSHDQQMASDNQNVGNRPHGEDNLAHHDGHSPPLANSCAAIEAVAIPCQLRVEPRVLAPQPLRRCLAMRICVRNLPPPRFFLANHSPLMPRERRSRPTAPGDGFKNGPRARQNPLLGAEFYPGAVRDPLLRGVNKWVAVCR